MGHDVSLTVSVEIRCLSLLLPMRTTQLRLHVPIGAQDVIRYWWQTWVGCPPASYEGRACPPIK